MTLKVNRTILMSNYMNKIGKGILLNLISLHSACQKWTLKEQKVENTGQ